jgi:hypothetical protein
MTENPVHIEPTFDPQELADLIRTIGAQSWLHPEESLALLVLAKDSNIRYHRTPNLKPRGYQFLLLLNYVSNF